MKILLSPAKTFAPLTETTNPKSLATPRFQHEADKLVQSLQKLKPAQLKRIMGISEALALLNHNRYQNWSFDPNDGKQVMAILAFKGDVYRGLQVETLKSRDLNRLQNSLFILSGLYGLLRPFDGIQHYRLEMGTAFKTRKWNDLYDFWKDRPTLELKADLKPQEPIINLASNEYFQVLKPYVKDLTVITPRFKDNVRGTHKVVSFKAKYARGLMAAFIARHHLKKPSDLKHFDSEAYRYEAATSTPTTPVFIRD